LLPIGDVEEDLHFLSLVARQEQENLPVLLHDGDPPGVIGGLFHPQGAIKFQVWEGDPEIK